VQEASHLDGRAAQPIEFAAGILVTAYPDDDVRARALNDGSFVTLASPLMRSI
jgi:hypothetical protein